jgi:hypothetical protein
MELIVLIAALTIPAGAHALSINAPLPDTTGDVHELPLYSNYRAVLLVGRELMPSDEVLYTMLVDGVEYFVEIDNPNLIPFLDGLREGAYEMTVMAYLSQEAGHLLDPYIEVDVIHVARIIFE